jgi:hypothetical protein
MNSISASYNHCSIKHWDTVDPKSEISNWTALQTVQSRISDFGFEMQDSSNFKMPFLYSHSQFEAVLFFELFVTFGLCATEDDV